MTLRLPAKSEANRGRSSEETVRDWHDLYLAQGRALACIRLGPPSRVIGRHRGGIVVQYTDGRGPPDWLVRTHRAAYLFDVKEARERIEFGKLPEEQVAALEAWDGDRCVSALLLHLGRHWWWCPWRGVTRTLYRSWRENGGKDARASLDADLLARIARPVADGDWLTAAEGGIR